MLLTGRELIIYILENHLEDEPVVKDGKFIGFSTPQEMAVKMNVGAASIRALADMGKIKTVNVTGGIYIPNA